MTRMPAGEVVLSGRGHRWLMHESSSSLEGGEPLCWVGEQGAAFFAVCGSLCSSPLTKVAGSSIVQLKRKRLHWGSAKGHQGRGNGSSLYYIWKEGQVALYCTINAMQQKPTLLLEQGSIAIPLEFNMIIAVPVIVNGSNFPLFKETKMQRSLHSVSQIPSMGGLEEKKKPGIISFPNFPSTKEL